MPRRQQSHRFAGHALLICGLDVDLSPTDPRPIEGGRRLRCRRSALCGDGGTSLAATMGCALKYRYHHFFEADPLLIADRSLRVRVGEPTSK
jgi:hypothetical protein